MYSGACLRWKEEEREEGKNSYDCKQNIVEPKCFIPHPTLGSLLLFFASPHDLSWHCQLLQSYTLSVPTVITHKSVVCNPIIQTRHQFWKVTCLLNISIWASIQLSLHVGKKCTPTLDSFYAKQHPSPNFPTVLNYTETSTALFQMKSEKLKEVPFSNTGPTVKILSQNK